MHKTIEELGLTEQETKTYLALLKKGSSLAGDIAKETMIHRRTIYDILYRLRSKGLVSNIIINNKTYFEAANPDRLLELLKEKEENMKKVLPDLRGLYKTTKEKKQVLFFRGQQALRTVFDDQLKEHKEILFVGKNLEVNKVLKYYFPRFDVSRKEKEIHIKAILDNDSKNREIVSKIPLAEVKYLSTWTDPTMFAYIYGNNVTLVVWSEDPIAVLIRQKEIADGFRNYFNLMWNIATK